MKSLKNNQLIGRMSGTLRQPQWIAVIASVGFHGALFAVGPSFSSLNMAALGGNAPQLEERRVPLIELTAEEQSRLPDFSSPSYSLFPGDDDDLLSLFPSEGSSQPLNPGSPFGGVPDLPSTSPPSATTIPPISSTPWRSSINLPAQRSPLPSVLTNPGTTAARPTPPAATPEPERSGGNGAAGTAENQGDRPEARQPGAADLELGSRNGANGAASAPLNPETAESSTEADNHRLARVQHSRELTSAEDTETAKQAWVETLTARRGEDMPQAEAPITIDIPYTQRICLSPEPTQGLLGMAIVPTDSGDSLELSTTLLKSTGYPFLNQAALQSLQDLANSDDASALEPGVLYQVQVNVDYDSETCVSSESLLKSRTAAQEDSESAEE
jgi:hypothetical protein